jgi:hypothetical protein
LLYLAGIRKVGQPFARYTIPLVPFFAVSAAVFLDLIISRLRVSPFYKRALITLAIAVLIFNPGIKSIYADYLLSKPDIRDLAGDWIYENIPAGSTIAIDNSQYAPHLYSTREQIRHRLSLINPDIKGAVVKRKRLELLLDLKDYPSHSYRLYYFSLEPAEFQLHMPAISYTKESLLKNNIEYIITNDFSMRRYAEFYNGIKNILVPVKRFYPFKQEGQSYSKYEYSYMPLDENLFKLANNGTGMTIYRLKR